MIIVSSFLFAEEFKKNIKRLSDRNEGNITRGLYNSRTNAFNLTNCTIYPTDEIYFRATSPTWIDITISVFVIGKNRLHKMKNIRLF